MTSDQVEEKLVWDPWPLARLLIMTSVFAFASHHYLGWTPDLRELASLPRQVFNVMSFSALISFGLAQLYLIVLMFPIYAVVTLNDFFYDAARWVSRVIFRVTCPRMLAITGLCGEIFLFGGIGLAIRRLFLLV